jgi:hypothetical protein
MHLLRSGVHWVETCPGVLFGIMLGEARGSPVVRLLQRLTTTMPRGWLA